MRLGKSKIAGEIRQIFLLTLQCEFSQCTSHWGPKVTTLRLTNPFVSEVQTIWGPGSSYIWGADQVGPGTLSHLGSNLEGPEPVSRSLLISCFLSRQDFTSARSNPVILHCEPYKCGSWNPWPKGTAWEKVTRKALLIDLEHCLPSKIQPIRLA